MLKHAVCELKFELFNPDVEISLRVIPKVERMVSTTTLAKTCITQTVRKSQCFQ
jgi:hypothetical protein